MSNTVDPVKIRRARALAAISAVSVKISEQLNLPYDQAHEAVTAALNDSRGTFVGIKEYVKAWQNTKPRPETMWRVL